MSPVASLVTTDRCSNVSMCLRISTECFLLPGIVPLLYSVGNKTYYYYYYTASMHNHPLFALIMLIRMRYEVSPNWFAVWDKNMCN